MIPEALKTMFVGHLKSVDTSQLNNGYTLGIKLFLSNLEAQDNSSYTDAIVSLKIFTERHEHYAIERLGLRTVLFLKAICLEDFNIQDDMFVFSEFVTRLNMEYKYFNREQERLDAYNEGKQIVIGADTIIDSLIDEITKGM